MKVSDMYTRSRRGPLGNHTAAHDTRRARNHIDQSRLNPGTDAGEGEPVDLEASASDEFDALASKPLMRICFTQTVRKSNDRSNVIPPVRPPVFTNDNKLSIFFAGNGLFPMFADIQIDPEAGVFADDLTVVKYSLFAVGQNRISPSKVPKDQWKVYNTEAKDKFTLVAKLGFTKAIGAVQQFFLEAVVKSDHATYIVRSDLLKVATKPRAVLLQDPRDDATIDSLRMKYEGLRTRDRQRGARGDDYDNVDMCVTPKGIVCTFKTPSRCLAFFGDCYQELIRDCRHAHLVPKRPGKMQPATTCHTSRFTLQFHSSERSLEAGVQKLALASTKATLPSPPSPSSSPASPARARRTDPRVWGCGGKAPRLGSRKRCWRPQSSPRVVKRARHGGYDGLVMSTRPSAAAFAPGTPRTVVLVPRERHEVVQAVVPQPPAPHTHRHTTTIDWSLRSLFAKDPNELGLHLELGAPTNDVDLVTEDVAIDDVAFPVSPANSHDAATPHFDSMSVEDLDAMADMQSPIICT